MIIGNFTYSKSPGHLHGRGCDHVELRPGDTGATGKLADGRGDDVAAHAVLVTGVGSLMISAVRPLQ